jgi:hypothetical protein
MNSLKSIAFRKYVSCPSSETLLEHGQGEGSFRGDPSVVAHLAVCDFCGAETYLFSQHSPCSVQSMVAEEMPSNLRLLVESLMYGSVLDLELLAGSPCERAPLTLTDA